LPSILEAIRRREENIKRLEGELAQAGEASKPVVVDPTRIRQQLADLSTLLEGSAEHARPIFKKLDLDVRLCPREGERPDLHAVATANLAALTREIPLLRRSLVRAEQESLGATGGPIPTDRDGRDSLAENLPDAVGECCSNVWPLRFI
jgi:hypothetical protein